MPKKANQFSDELFSILKESKGVRVRAGMGTHRFIGIWFVVVQDRVFARSWSVKPEGWYHTFLKRPRGAIQVGKTKIPIRAVPIANKRIRDSVDRAYLAKYSNGWEVKYANDLVRDKSRATTIEFVPQSQSRHQSAAVRK